MSRKSRRRQKKTDPTAQRTGLVAGLFLIFVSLAAAYQSPRVQFFFHSIQNHPALQGVAGKIPDPDNGIDGAKGNDPSEKERLKPEDEDRNGDDSLKFKKRAYDFRAYPNKTIPAGSRERAWEQFQQHYPPDQKKSLWKPAKQAFQ